MQIRVPEAPQEDGLSSLPQPILLNIGNMAGVPATASLMQASRFFYHAFANTQKNRERALPILNDAKRLGDLFVRGAEFNIIEMLKSHQAAHSLIELFQTPVEIAHSRAVSIKFDSVLHYLLWCGDRDMYEKVSAYLPDNLKYQLLEQYAQKAAAADSDSGLYFSFKKLIAAFDAFCDYQQGFIASGDFISADSLSGLKAIKAGSQEDLDLQALLQRIVAEMAELPAHAISEILHPARSFFVNDKAPEFNEGKLPRTSVLKDGSSCQSREDAGKDFGVTYGVIRTQTAPTRMDVKDALKYAKSFVKFKNHPERLIPLMQIQANAIRQLGEKRLTWVTNLLTNSRLINVASPARTR